jgi:hypothetical protein
MCRTKPIVRGILSIIFLIFALFFSNILPHNLYHEEILDTWQNSQYSHMVGLFKWVGLLLPWFGMLWCVNKIIRLKYNGISNSSNSNQSEEQDDNANSADGVKSLKRYKSRQEKELEKQNIQNNINQEEITEEKQE